MVAEFEPAVAIISWKDPIRSKWEDVLEIDCRLMDKQKDDLTKLPTLPYRPTPRIFKTDDILAVDLITEGDDTVVKADSYIQIPVTFKNKRTKEYTDVYVGLKARPEFTITCEDTLAFVGGIRKEWAYLKVPKGSNLVLGHRNAFTSRVLVVPYDDGV